MPFGEVEGGFDLVEGEPFEVGDFVFLAFGDLGRILGAGEEEDDGFDNVEARDVVREGVASGFVEDNIEIGFFFDFAEGGFDFGFAGFDVTFRKAGEAIVLVDDEDFIIVNNDGAARSFGSGVLWGVSDGVGGGKVGNVESFGVWRRVWIVHEDIIYYLVGFDRRGRRGRGG